ncbi:MAG: translation initiation factor [Elusimicrobia bacterium]|nr:translation initiation factor [Elusimicrobiota bacterium]MDE2314557.1 translation initiation factor [Elusimicrobiota bacterium]
MGDRIVYSTDPDWGKKGTPRQPEPVRLSFRRGAKGSGVTRLERLIMHPTIKDHLLSELKRRLGCGGTIKDGVLEFQGDHRDVLSADLQARGYKVRLIG